MVGSGHWTLYKPYYPQWKIGFFKFDTSVLLSIFYNLNKG